MKLGFVEGDRCLTLCGRLSGSSGAVKEGNTDVR